MGENLTIGFIGNPNCGKTTLFNAYTGANLKVANWPGVTVEKVEGAIKDHDMNIRLVDLPGTYSLTSYTMEEQVSRQFILSDEVDVIIDVADASALERNLYLTLQLLELGKPVVLALNMMDIVEKRGMEIDTHRLPEMLGIPVIPVSARKRTGLDVLLHAAAHHKDCKDPDCLIHHHKYTSKHRHDHHSEYAMVYSDAIEDKIDLIMAELKRKYPGLTNYRWYAIKLLEQDKEITANYPVDLPDVLDRNYESDIINEKYDFIQEIIREVLVNKDRQDALSIHTMDNCASEMSFPLKHYRGISVVINLSVVVKNPPEILSDSGIDILQFKEKFCADGNCFIMRAKNEIEHIFSELYSVPDCLQKPYFRLKVQELLLFLCMIDVSKEKRRELYTSPQVEIIKTIHKRLTSNLQERPTIEELSKEYLINPTTLTRPKIICVSWDGSVTVKSHWKP